ncbi:MAG: hypothetical protein KDA61_19425 [Planctomycetales bacterium]|nr:hypothetical protein [Planctomycetales bacterium]
MQTFQSNSSRRALTVPALAGGILPIATIVVAGWVLGSSALADEGDPSDLSAALAVLRRADDVSSDPLRMQAAYRTASTAGANSLPTLFDAMSDAKGTLAQNWLRAAIDAIVEAQLAAGDELDAKLLERTALDDRLAPRARRTAFELLEASDPAARDRLLPQMLDDSSVELRYDAVQQLLDAAKAAEGERRRSMMQQAFDAALDVDQAVAIAGELEKEEVKSDLSDKLGFIRQWHMVGTFDNAGLKGFDAVYPPEQLRDAGAFDPNASYAGKEGEVRWKSFETDHRLGWVNVNKALAPEKEAVAYSAAIVEVGHGGPAQLRVGCKNAPKVWCNGELAGAFEAYHAGSGVDQFILPVTLRPGANLILVKTCQNEKRESWEQDWDFCLRVTDELGAAIPFQVK